MANIVHNIKGNEFIKKAIDKHGDKYGYSKVDYINNRTKVIIICKIHGEFEQIPYNHTSGSKCPKCNVDELRVKNNVPNSFIKKAIDKHGDKYDYTKVNYINSQTKVIIICKIHGEFEQIPNAHLRGTGCPICIGTKKSNKGGFIKKAIDKHGNKYDYTKVNYINTNTKVKIICPTHGIFEQKPYHHLNGHGCKDCANELKVRLKTTKGFIIDAVLVHRDKYDYSLVDYKGSHTKIKIICPTHGDFMQTPDGHLQGQGCPKCSSFGPSKSEIEILEFIKSISITAETSNRTVLNGLELDIYIPSKKIAIEFDGLYWHSELHKDKNYHLNKTELCLKKGIQLIHIFEDEWIFKKNIVKSRLKNILGLTSNKIFGRKTVVKEVETKQARIFFENNHLQGYTNSKIKLGLYYKDELVSCMLFSKPRIGIGGSYDGYELTRFANLVNTNVIGGASKLLKHFEKTYQPVEIRSYADRRWSDGGLYDVLGFELSHINKPNYWYIEGNQRKHRFGYRKVNLKKLGFDIKDKTEHEIMLERKIYRIYDCGTLSYKFKI